jgi:hypothetical protein
MNPIEVRIRRASVLIGLGMLAGAASVLLNHPLAFVGFLAAACPLVLGGVAIYLTSLVRR